MIIGVHRLLHSMQLHAWLHMPANPMFVHQCFRECKARELIRPALSRALLPVLCLQMFRAFSTYMTLATESRIMLDHFESSSDDTLQVNFNFSFPHLKCEYASVDATNCKNTRVPLTVEISVCPKLLKYLCVHARTHVLTHRCLTQPHLRTYTQELALRAQRYLHIVSQLRLRIFRFYAYAYFYS